MKKIMSIIIASILIFSLPLTTFASNNKSKELSTYKLSTADMVGKEMQCVIKDKSGNDAIMRIEKMDENSSLNASLRATIRTWKISFIGGLINSEFYMDVSNNKVISAYNYKIITIGCTYSDLNFVRGTSYAKLSCQISSYLDLVNFNGWLKGTCTGSNNDVVASWNF